MEYIIGLDIGTTGCKATVFTRKGEVCQKAYREYTQKSYDGMIEPEMVWAYVKEVLKECVQDHPYIEAICTASFGESVVAVDRDGKALAPSILYTNSNAEEEWKALEASVGKSRIAEITGLISHPMYTISRLMWMKKNQPDIYGKTEKFLFFGSYIECCLGAEHIAEDTLASRSMAYDVENRVWSQEILGKAGIAEEKMPRIVASGDEIGRVSEPVCAELGMKVPPLLIAGGHDQPCAALGMGAIHGGDAAYGMGTVECFSLIMDSCKQTELMQKYNLVCAPHVVPGKYITYGVLFSGGIVIQDLRNKFYAKEREECKNQKLDIYDKMMQEIPDRTDLLYLPHLAGGGTPHMDPNDSGGIVGIRLETARGEWVRAALEGIAFDMRQNTENMESCGLPILRIMAGGGGAKSDISLQVKADIIQRELLAADDVQAGTRGVFYIAAKALGWIADYGISAEEFKYHKIEPDRSKEEDIKKQYHRYLDLYEFVRAL